MKFDTEEIILTNQEHTQILLININFDRSK
jgi:hypothetical protein